MQAERGASRGTPFLWIELLAEYEMFQVRESEVRSWLCLFPLLLVTVSAVTVPVIS